MISSPLFVLPVTYFTKRTAKEITSIFLNFEKKGKEWYDQNQILKILSQNFFLARGCQDIKSKLIWTQKKALDDIMRKPPF